MTLLAVAAAVAVMAGAALQSAVGFGFALVAAPLLYAAAPSPEQAVGLMTLLGLEVNLLTLLAERRRPAPVWRDVAAVVAWSLPGALAGVAVLRALDDVALQLLVTAGVLVALAVNRRAARRAPAPGAPARAAALGAAGRRARVGRAQHVDEHRRPAGRAAACSAAACRPARCATRSPRRSSASPPSPPRRSRSPAPSGAVPAGGVGRRAASRPRALGHVAGRPVFRAPRRRPLLRARAHGRCCSSAVAAGPAHACCCDAARTL